MLLFIKFGYDIILVAQLFQYISCYCLSNSVHRVWTAHNISIHLMLLFIQIPASGSSSPLLFQYISCYCLSKGTQQEVWHAEISIHLMLLFINNDMSKHCRRQIISIHLMLLFICIALSDQLIPDRFQYISCYCLSFLFWRKIQPDCDFNTSHVTVYRRHFIQSIKLSEFQYISCYCLSPIPNLKTLLIIHFNTSHVTVYRDSGRPKENYLFISIHLMLLFIINQRVKELRLALFQYISCYCLSFSCSFSKILRLYFNTSHVTVYLIAPINSSGVIQFQYISCYCLSEID